MLPPRDNNTADEYSSNSTTADRERTDHDDPSSVAPLAPATSNTDSTDQQQYPPPPAYSYWTSEPPPYPTATPDHCPEYRSYDATTSAPLTYSVPPPPYDVPQQQQQAGHHMPMQPKPDQSYVGYMVLACFVCLVCGNVVFGSIAFCLASEYE